MAGTGNWYIRPSVEYGEVLKKFCREERLEQIMLDNVHYCRACGRCAPGKQVEFFGKSLEHVCCSPIDFEFHNPDEQTLACAKKLVEFRRRIIAGSARS